MSVLSRFRGWLRRARRLRVPKKAEGALREFVYLDDVSVYSILASRKHGIATEFTESETASLNNEVGGSIGAGFGGASIELEARRQTGRIQASQVLRKAIIQTSFKELYENEQNELAIIPPTSSDVPKVKEVAELQERLDALIIDRWVVDPNNIQRGELLEVEVELGADPLFRMASIITILRDLMEDKENLFGHEVTAFLPQMSSMAQVLESLLVGLVPIRGRLVDYRTVRIDSREVLVHRRLLDQMSSEVRQKAHPTFVVGVTQRDLFWKDIRRILFSGARYTVFGRLGISGLTHKWHPIKLADVLAGLTPQFDELVEEFSDRARLAMNAPADSSSAVVFPDAEAEMQAIRGYAELLVRQHDGSVSPEVIERVLRDIPSQEGWSRTVDGRRSVLNEVSHFVDRELKVETPGEVAYVLRAQALANAGLSAHPLPGQATGSDTPPSTLFHDEERFLDTEIVAIYW